MAAFRDDVELMLSLLEQTVAGEHGIGLEIIGKPEHFQEEKHLGRIKENIAYAKERVKELYVVVHGFSGGQVYESGLADMRTDQGKHLLLTYLQLAKDTKADYVHVHSAAGYKGKDKPFDEKKPELDKIRKNMLICAQEYPILIGMENLPKPSMGDDDTNPDENEIWRDCVDSLEDLLYIVGGTNLKTTFDTCHYACNKEGKIDIAQAAQQLGKYLYHLHVSDVSGLWKPGESHWKEGVIPGYGHIGEHAFKEFFSYIRENHPEIGICIEVSNTDFKNPAESEKSIKKVLNWLR